MDMINSMTSFRVNRNARQRNRSVIPKAVTPHVADCPICMEPIDNTRNVIITKCKHQFCSECLLREMNNRNTCPICRTELRKKKENKTLSNIELRDVVMRNLSYMPDENLNIVANILPLLKASKIPDIFEENVNIMEELQKMEENILTTMNLFGYYLASDVRDIIESNNNQT